MAVRDTIIALLAAFAVTAALCPYIIPILHRFKFGQEVRDDGPQSHLKKQGTPTMGGVMILAGFLVPVLIFSPSYPEMIPVAFLTIGFGLIGFADDFLKIHRHQSEGLNPKQKLAMQFAVTAVFAWYIVAKSEAGCAMLIPFWREKLVLPTAVFVPVLFFIVLGTDNGTNFTDGLDGLLSSVTLPIAGLLALISAAGNWGISPAAGAMMGALMGFLLFNAHPAKVFMGDTGSLAIGGFVAGSAFMMRIPIFIAIFGFIYMMEVISVIIQVGYFKMTHGKRFFRMAPIHHHFELGGASETQIVNAFSIVTFLLCLAALAGM